MLKIDQHFHTTLSDGKKDNSEILEQYIKWKDVSFCVATEHDIVNTSFRDFLYDLSVDTCYWVEISACDYENRKSMHILHYSSSINNLLDSKLDSLREARIYKIKQQVEKLKSNWFIINYSDFINYFEIIEKINPSNLNAFNIAEYIYKNKKTFIENNKIIKSISWKDFSTKGFFENFLKETWIYSHIWWKRIIDYELSFDDLQEIKTERSVLSIAHPNFTFKSIEVFNSRIEHLVKNRWINAIEINAKANKEWADTIMKVKKDFDLILTFWSDCHFISDEGNNDKHSELFSFNSYVSEKILDLEFDKFKEKIS